MWQTQLLDYKQMGYSTVWPWHTFTIPSLSAAAAPKQPLGQGAEDLALLALSETATSGVIALVNPSKVSPAEQKYHF